MHGSTMACQHSCVLQCLRPCAANVLMLASPSLHICCVSHAQTATTHCRQSIAMLACSCCVCVLKGEDDMDPDGQGGPARPPQPGPVLLLQVHHHDVIMLTQHCSNHAPRLCCIGTHLHVLLACMLWQTCSSLMSDTAYTECPAVLQQAYHHLQYQLSGDLAILIFWHDTEVASLLGF